MNQPQGSLIVVASSDSIAQRAISESVRPCLACGYDLQGLGEEPRCPECGLLNIPEGYRRQVWELVDSGKWFFSSFFGVFRNRPPGWWWSLDRPGDVRRASIAGILYLLISFLIVLIAGALTGAVTCTVDETRVYARGRALTNPAETEVYVTRELYTFRLARIPFEVTVLENGSKVVQMNAVPRGRLVATRSIQFSRGFLFPCCVLLAFVVSAWMFPACVGIWTQIRKSLPPFARARRTIFAASLYECHRMIYVAICIAILLFVEAWLRWNKSGLFSWPNYGFKALVPFVILGVAAAGWIGPLRSDYTKQLVQSRGHAIRIFLMYAVIFPGITVFAVVALIATYKAGY